MAMAAKIMVGLVALLHVYFMILEMFLWTKPKGLKIFGNTLEQAQSCAVLAANQGLYNGFLAAGLFYGVRSVDPVGLHFQVFFLCCVVVAGLYGGWTVNNRIYFIQALPAGIALTLVLMIK